MSHNNPRKTVGEWLKESFEWRIPVYQRHYAWNPDEDFGPTQLFWEIVEEHANQKLAKDEDDPHPHYFGVILVENQGGNLGEPQRLDVVDGQQRLTTINIAMFAIIDVADTFHYREEIQDKLKEYIFNNSKSENRSPKLHPTNFDSIQFDNLLASAFDSSQSEHQDDNEQASKSRIVQACKFFSKKFEAFIKEHGSDNALETINTLIKIIIDGFEFILIELKPEDEAQKVFESLNNTARPLTTFDLIRNNVFYRADKEPSTSSVELFKGKIWQEFENEFWEKTPGRSDNNTHIETYIARMLMAKNRQYLLMDRNSIFKEYKKFAERQEDLAVKVPRELEIISEYVDVYKYLMGETNRNPLGDDFNFGYFMYKISKSTVFYPALFIIRRCNESNETKQRMVDLLESYVIRRHICKLTSANYNQFAPEIFQTSKGKPDYEMLHDRLTSQEKKTRSFPNDESVRNACLTQDFYTRNNLINYIFDRIVAAQIRESFEEVRDLKGLTIDHIIPQSWSREDGWKSALADFNEGDVDNRINTIGNLTPMSRGRNSAKSNHGWDGEKGAQELLKDCGLKFTKKLAEKESWGISDIEDRSRELAGIICKIWPENIPAEGQ